MLIRVAIDPHISDELAGGVVPRPGGMLIRHLRDRCLIALGPNAGAAELRDAFGRCGTPEFAAIILQLLQHRLADPTMGDRDPIAIDDIENPEHLGTWSHLAELLLVPQWRVEYLAQHGTALQPEVTSLRDALSSTAFDRLDSAWSRFVDQGESREAIWREVFEDFATRASTVYVVDRYFAKSFHEVLADGPKAVKESGAGWFLSHLARSRQVRNVRVVSSARELHRSDSPEDVGRTIQAWFGSLPSSTQLDLHIVGGNFRHRRSLAFDGYAGFAIDRGLESFDGPSIGEEFELFARGESARKVADAFAELISQR